MIFEPCVEIGAFLYDFSLFQVWFLAALDNSIKKFGHFLLEVSIKTAV